MPAGGDSTEPPGSVLGTSHWHVRVRMDTASEQPGPQPEDACQGPPSRVLLASTLDSTGIRPATKSMQPGPGPLQPTMRRPHSAIFFLPEKRGRRLELLGEGDLHSDTSPVHSQLRVRGARARRGC
jgi:hypothetical protein